MASAVSILLSRIRVGDFMKKRNLRIWIFLVIFGLGAAAWVIFWERNRPAPSLEAARVVRPNVVLIVVDTLRPDHMSFYGYGRPTTPNLDRWFAKARVFDQAYAPISFTPPSVMSLLSGLYPMNHRVRMVFQKLPDRVPVISDYLKPLGYHTAAVISNMVLTQEATNLGTRFDYFDDYVDELVPVRKGYERNAGRTTDAALEWLQKARFLSSPHFVWLHYMDPHGPYAPPPEKPIAFDHETPLPIDIGRVPIYNRLGGIRDGRYYVDRYDEEIAYVDREIDRFLSAYQEAGLLEEAVVIFTSDHGEYMMDHEKWFTHGYHVYNASTRVPLMILEPAREPETTSTPVSLVDLVPTILSFAKAERPPRLDGRSLLKPMAADIFLEGLGAGQGKQFRGLVRGRHKWTLYSEAGGELAQYRRYYDLSLDPNELSPSTWADAGDAPAALLETLLRDPDPSGMPKTVVAGHRLTMAKSKPAEGLPMVVEGLDEETLERLRALGYVQ